MYSANDVYKLHVDYFRWALRGDFNKQWDVAKYYYLEVSGIIFRRYVVPRQKKIIVHDQLFVII